MVLLDAAQRFSQTLCRLPHDGDSFVQVVGRTLECFERSSLPRGHATAL
jgi:hypothetical protein